jgi:TRAP transporter 4TM/12TM fusion protein
MRQLTGPWKKAFVTIGYLWCAFLMYTSLRFAFHPMVQGSISLGTGLILVFMLYPMRKKKSPETHPSVLDVIMMAASVVICVYVAINHRYFEEYAALTMSHKGTAIGTIALILMLEGSRRTLGKAVPILTLSFLAYVFFGNLIPGHWGHSGYSPGHVMWQLYQTTNGYWGVVTDIVSRVVLIFIIFGPVLFATGAGESFMGLANFVGGRVKGGAAQIAVIASGLFGMFSGAAVANVATTGAFTIPTMKKVGYRNNFAGAVEAAASSGGQLMPPIMGAGAFVMAEFLGKPYLDIMIAAIIPAILYYLGVASGIFFEASRAKLGKLPPDMVPKAKEVFYWKSLARVVIPLGVLLWFLLKFYPAQNCAGWALVTSIVLYTFTGGAFKWSELKKRFAKIGDGFLGGVRSMCWLIVMIVCIQTVVCLIALAGFGVKFAAVVIGLGKANLLLALVVTMIAAIILGMGMPTVAAYVIAVSVIGPALLKLGIPLFNTHIFVFYFAVISAITPPVAVATYPAAALADGQWISIAWIAMRLAIAAYIVPFLFIYNPPLLMIGGPVTILLAAFFSLLGIICLAIGGMGYCYKATTIPERIIFVAAGIAFLVPDMGYRVLAFALIGIGLLSQRFMPPIALVGTRNE